jgi:hypothetical protein
VRRKHELRRIRVGHFVRAAIPIAIVLVFSAKRVEYHVGEPIGLISTNGPLNEVFGRCHNQGIESYTGAKPGTGERSGFGPPPFYLLREREARNPRSWIQLDPAMGYDLKFRGRMWDKEPLRKIAADCVAKTGWAKQAKYAATHVLMLWGYNITWPDSGKPEFRPIMKVAHDINVVVLMPPTVFAMFLALRRRWTRQALLALHLWALVIVSILYFGDTRFRAPYDGIALVLGADVVVRFGKRALAWLLSRRWHAAGSSADTIAPTVSAAAGT